jgi:hypothetical protein
MNPDERVPLLEFNSSGSPNLHEWREALEVTVGLDYPDHATIIKNRQHRVFPDLALPLVPFDDQNDPMGISRTRLLEEVKRHDKKASRYRDDQTQVYYLIISTLSRRSLDRLAQEGDEWELVQNDREPLTLLNLIMMTHLTAASATKSRFDAMDEATREWANMRQRRTETTESFKRRVRMMIDKFAILRMPIVNDPYLANTFIRKLDPSRFADLQCHIINSPLISTRDALPQNIFEAAELAENWHSVSIKGTAQHVKHINH